MNLRMESVTPTNGKYNMHLIHPRNLFASIFAQVPHVTTRSPPEHHKAKALHVEASWACCAMALTQSPSPIPFKIQRVRQKNSIVGIPFCSLRMTLQGYRVCSMDENMICWYARVLMVKPLIFAGSCVIVAIETMGRLDVLRLWKPSLISSSETSSKTKLHQECEMTSFPFLKPQSHPFQCLDIQNQPWNGFVSSFP